MKTLLQTSRLIFREITEEDAQGMFNLDSDPDVHIYLGKKPITTLEEARENIRFIRAQYIQNGIARWAVIERSSNEFIGWAGFKLITEETNSRINYHDLGYRFIKSAWGKGYATEAAVALVQHGLNVLKLTEIFAIADAKNIVSRKVLEKAGFSVVETFEYQGDETFWFEIELSSE